MRSSRAPLFVPLLLIIIGGVLLLNNFSLLPGLSAANIDLLRFWPVLIVLVGLQLLFRGDIGITWQTQTFGITRGTVQSASLEANSGELDVKIRALRREGRLVAGQYTARSRPNLNVRGTHAQLTMQRGQTWPFSLGDWEIGLARDLPWNLLISTYLGELDVDLRDLNAGQVNLGTGIGDVNLTLSNSVDGGVRARSTFGNVIVTVPPDVEAVIRVISKPMARLQVDETRFLLLEPGVYATLGHEKTDSPVYAEVASTLGTVRLG